MARPEHPGDGSGPGEHPRRARWSPGSTAAAPLVVAASLTGMQGFVSGVLAITELASMHSGRVVMGATNALFFGLYGVGLIVFALAMSRLRPWSRSPVLLAQLLTLGLAWNYRHAPTTLLAVAGAVSALIVLAGVLHPTSIEALNRPEHRRDGAA